MPGWVQADVPVQVHGRTITGGMIYFGRGMRSVSGARLEPALIDPRVPVEWNDPDHEGQGLSYWPRYDALTPRTRGGYLTWLVGSRADRAAPIGFVFLYFYGLERRALVDLELGRDPRHSDEIAQIAAEVERLRSIYAENSSFDHYSRGLLDAITIASSADLPLNAPTTEELRDAEKGLEVPPIIALALGRRSAAGEPIPADWALAFLRSHPDTKLRTPATRCAPEFDDLFRHLYAQRHGEGMVIRPPKRRLALTYHPASAGFSGQYKIDLDDLPDVTKIVGPIRQLTAIAQDATDQLDAYSRYLGRNPEGRGSALAVGLLPDALLTDHGGDATARLRSWIGQLNQSTVEIDQVVAAWDPQRTAKLRRPDAVALAALLAKLDIGIEPDVRFGGSTPKPGTPVVLFPLPAGAPAAPSSAYSAAALLVRLAAVVSAADGSVSDSERAHLADHLETALGLDQAECARLEAHLSWLVATSKGSLAGVRKRVESLDEDQRTAIGHFLIDVAAADDQVTPQEVASLTKIYGLLGLDEGEVYRRLHNLGSDDPGPVTVSTPTDTAPRWEIPPAPNQTSGTIQLDHDKVQRRLAETAAVGKLLEGIFGEDDGADESPPGSVPPPDPVGGAETDGATIHGLDVAHSHLAVAFTAQPEWERAHAEDLAHSFGLPLLEGAIEKINDAAFDVCGEPLIEGEDPLEINDYVTQEFTA